MRFNEEETKRLENIFKVLGELGFSASIIKTVRGLVMDWVKVH